MSSFLQLILLAIFLSKILLLSTGSFTTQSPDSSWNCLPPPPRANFISSSSGEEEVIFDCYNYFSCFSAAADFSMKVAQHSRH